MYNQVFVESIKIRDCIKVNRDFPANPIDKTLNTVKPFEGGNGVRLIIIGQDPTVQKLTTRLKIEYTLNLDKEGPLKSYISKICQLLDIPFESIYATNLFKYFYTYPPQRFRHILDNHLPENLELLKKELAQFPDVPIITLGQPVLQLLSVKDKEVKFFWGHPKAVKTAGQCSSCDSNQNQVNRKIFPFPHQTSMTKEFYRDNLEKYCSYMAKNL
jgi:uracil-DNA glycosylase